MGRATGSSIGRPQPPRILTPLLEAHFRARALAEGHIGYPLQIFDCASHSLGPGRFDQGMRYRARHAERSAGRDALDLPRGYAVQSSRSEALWRDDR